MRFIFSSCVLSALVLGMSSIARANPVSFKDGWGVMPAYSTNWSDLEANYSVTNKYAFGLAAYYRDGSDSNATFGIGKFNYLVKRWNELESQANLYISAGIGGRHDSVHDGALAEYGSLEADYETRRVYTLLGFETLRSPNDVNFNRLRYRAGVAPYLAPFDGFHTWLIAQVDYMPEMNEEVTVTPLLRFFYNNFAFEAGVSLQGDPFVSGMAHF